MFSAAHHRASPAARPANHRWQAPENRPAPMARKPSGRRTFRPLRQKPAPARTHPCSADWPPPFQACACDRKNTPPRQCQRWETGSPGGESSDFARPTGDLSMGMSALTGRNATNPRPARLHPDARQRMPRRPADGCSPPRTRLLRAASPSPYANAGHQCFPSVH